MWWQPQCVVASETNETCVNNVDFDTNIEMKKVSLVVNINNNNNILPQVSHFFKLKKVIAYCLRFVFNWKNISKNRKTGRISVDELNNAELCIVKLVQHECFADEINELKKHNRVSSGSKILKLNPFIDENNILRVGGRMANANMSYDAKHQVLLPHHQQVTRLVIIDSHLECVHGPPKLTESIVRAKYWIPNGFKTIKYVIMRCVVCHRYAAKTMHQLMADLPASRVNVPEKPFSNCVVDYTGAINIKTSKTRNAKIVKAYIAIFCCMTTKAMHIELVSDMTAEAFIAAFRRLDVVL